MPHKYVSLGPKSSILVSPFSAPVDPSGTFNPDYVASEDLEGGHYLQVFPGNTDALGLGGDEGIDLGYIELRPCDESEAGDTVLLDFPQQLETELSMTLDRLGISDAYLDVLDYSKILATNYYTDGHDLNVAKFEQIGKAFLEAAQQCTDSRLFMSKLSVMRKCIGEITRMTEDLELALDAAKKEIVLDAIRWAQRDITLAFLDVKQTRYPTLARGKQQAREMKPKVPVVEIVPVRSYSRGLDVEETEPEPEVGVFDVQPLPKRPVNDLPEEYLDVAGGSPKVQSPLLPIADNDRDDDSDDGWNQNFVAFASSGPSLQDEKIQPLRLPRPVLDDDVDVPVLFSASSSGVPTPSRLDTPSEGYLDVDPAETESNLSKVDMEDVLERLKKFRDETLRQAQEAARARLDAEAKAEEDALRERYGITDRMDATGPFPSGISVM